jgi:DNA-binding transcriptional regulator YbjK
MTQLTKSQARRALILDTSLQLLAEKGARGITHRGIDERAGIPQGSTSNVFRTRAALVQATVEHHLERELEFIDAVRGSLPEKITISELAAVLATGVDGVASPDMAELAAARFEIYLEGRRNPQVAAGLAFPRQSVTALAADLLKRAGIKHPDKNAALLIPFIEGLNADRLFNPATAVSHDDTVKALGNFLKGLK